MAIYDPVGLAGLTSAPAVVKAGLALAPGGVVSGVAAIFSPGLVVGAAPLFAIGTLGVAAVIMGFFVRADRRWGRRGGSIPRSPRRFWSPSSWSPSGAA